MNQEQTTVHTGGGNALGGNRTRERNYTLNTLNIPLTKKYFKLLQAIHHSEILSDSILTGICPKGMERQVKKLASFIKPSSPSFNTTERVKHNTHKWLQDVLETLRVHYDEVMSSILGDLPLFDERALQVAVGWSKLKYKRRFTITSVDTLRGLLTSPTGVTSIPNSPHLDSVEYPPLPELPVRGGQTPDIRDSTGSKQQRTNLSRSRRKRLQQGLPLLELPGQSPVTGSGLQNTPSQGNKNLPGKGLGTPRSTSGRSPGKERDTNRQLGEITTETNTGLPQRTFAEALKIIKTSSVVMEIPPHPIMPLNPRMEDTPSDSEEARVAPVGDTHLTIEHSEGEADMEMGTVAHHPPLFTNVAVHMNDSLHSFPGSQLTERQQTMVVVTNPNPSHLPQPNPSMSLTIPLGTAEGLTPNLPPVPKPNSLGSNRGSTSPLSAHPNLNPPPLTHTPNTTNLGHDPQLPLGTAGRVPVRHPISKRKIFEWKLEVTKPILFLGDSNLARIPIIERNDIQVDSFPGATCDHLRGVIEKLTPQLQVEQVVLAIGLVNCLKQNTPDTLLKQMRRVLQVCDTRFPRARIYVAKIPYSERLNLIQQSLVRRFNVDIIKHCDYLPVLEEDQFCVMPDDPVHWTPETAGKLFKLWLQFLN